MLTLWLYPGSGATPRIVRSLQGLLPASERLQIREVSRSAGAILRTVPDGWAVLGGTIPDVIVRIPPIHRKIMKGDIPVKENIPVMLQIPDAVVNELVLSRSVADAALRISHLGCQIEDEGKGTPPVDVGYVRLILPGGQSTLLRTAPLGEVAYVRS